MCSRSNAAVEENDLVLIKRLGEVARKFDSSRRTMTQRLAQCNVRLMEPRFAGRHRDSQAPGHLSVRKSLYVMQQNNVPSFRREAAQRLPQGKSICRSPPT